MHPWHWHQPRDQKLENLWPDEEKRPHSLSLYPHASLPCMATYFVTRPRFLHSPFIVYPPMQTPPAPHSLSLCCRRAEGDGVRSVQKGKRKECLAALLSSVVFSFLLCQTSEQPPISLHYNQVFRLTVLLNMGHLFFHVLLHAHARTRARSVWQSGVLCSCSKWAK